VIVVVVVIVALEDFERLALGWCKSVGRCTQPILTLLVDFKVVELGYPGPGFLGPMAFEISVMALQLKLNLKGA
jgi:hypothetical protein